MRAAFLLAAGLFLWAGGGPATAAPSCAYWNTADFFKMARPADVSRCLKTRTVNVRDKYGLTPLHTAALSKTPVVLKILLDAGANLNARDEKGWTPLHLAAARSKTPAVVKTLLDAGADPAAKDISGKIPWDYAKKNTALKGTSVYWRLNEARFK